MKNVHSSNLEITNEFAHALHLLKNSKQNLYITGVAGTGKSTLLKLFLEKTTEQYVILAPTGLAAINVRGQTIHSFFHLPTKLFTLEDPQIKFNKKNAKKFKALDLIIIDEISMVRADLLDGIDYTLRLHCKSSLPFAGIRLIFFGDLMQLPPVVVGQDMQQYFKDNYGGPYFFNAISFKKLSFSYIELTKIFRQKDDKFIKILNRIRNNKATDNDLEILNQHWDDPSSEKKDNKEILTLCTTNKIAININQTHIAALPSKEWSYNAKIEGDFPVNSYPTSEPLLLKVGAQVMMLRNDINKNWVNGDVGIITDLEENKIRVRLHQNIVDVDKVEWEVIDYQYNSETKKLEQKIIGRFTQYPLNLAWAITIHKSQGKTLRKVKINLGTGAFSHGQTYVALSRCTSLDGLFLETKIRPRDIFVDPIVLDFIKQHN